MLRGQIQTRLTVYNGPYAVPWCCAQITLTRLKVSLTKKVTNELNGKYSIFQMGCATYYLTNSSRKLRGNFGNVGGAQVDVNAIMRNNNNSLYVVTLFFRTSSP